MATTSSFVLYSTTACHLCDQAVALLQPWLAEGWTLQEVDISESDELFERYGLLIPVLRLEQASKELCWPFTASDIAGLVDAANSA